MTVVYEDGHTCTFDLVELRQYCPCATCRQIRDRGEFPYTSPKPAESLRIVDAKLVGAWGISIAWNDGHGTGIYPWEALRTWSEAEHEI